MDDKFDLKNFYIYLINKYKNKNLFDLKKFDKEHLVDFCSVYESLIYNKCLVKSKDFILEFIKSIKYINCDDFINIYNKNAEEIINLSTNENY